MSVGPAAKPLDVGSGRVCASFDLGSAAWLSVGAPHAIHGFIELNALPPFDESGRGDAAATRRHRLSMTRQAHAFLRVEVDGALPVLAADTRDPAAPRWASGGITVVAATQPDAGRIRQEWSLEAGESRQPGITIQVRGAIDRPALAEITELDPPQPTGAVTALAMRDGAVILTAPALPAEATVAVSGAEVGWAVAENEAVGTVRWAADVRSLSFAIEVALGVPAAPSGDADLGFADDDPSVARAVTYVRGCTALVVDTGERAILTDHRILPLSWTRDAYWQALALLAADGRGDRERVADHLRWLWRRCERPDGRWVRSHHANGQPKDLAFQADQTLYPMVELADYWRTTESLPAGVAWDDEVPRTWQAVVGAIDPATGLIATAENAADDPAAAPFIGSSQITLWYAAERLAELAESGAGALDAAALRGTAAAVRDTFASRLAASPGPWPYAVDARGHGVAYHDANDLPVALAPLWGFCDPDDAGWRATMAFAFSDANPAWSPGARRGLGSSHTPGAWTLGDVQAWIRARATGDRGAMTASLERLGEVAFGDGMLPEAYAADGRTDGHVRHWFAWPGAALAALLLLDRRGLLEERLSARRSR